MEPVPKHAELEYISEQGNAWTRNWIVPVDQDKPSYVNCGTAQVFVYFVIYNLKYLTQFDGSVKIAS